MTIPFRREWERCACGRPLKVGGKGETKFLYCPKCEKECVEQQSNEGDSNTK